MRKAKGGPTVNAKRFFFINGDKKYPRAEVIVDGYCFTFTCDKDLTPVIVTDTQAHGSIKAKAYAVAAQIFKKEKRAADERRNAPPKKQSELF